MSDETGEGLSSRFDEHLARIFPTWALKRVQSKRAFMVANDARAYEAASRGRRTSGWKTSGASANTEIAGGFKTTRNRARDLVRNNELARSAVKRLVANRVGLGIKIDPVDAAEHEAWTEWVNSPLCDYEEQLDFYGLQRLIDRCMIESGETLIRKRIDRKRRLTVPLQLQVLEPDFLDDEKTELHRDGSFTLLGIKFNSLGKRIGYWLFDEHPGESIGFKTGKFKSKLVPAESIIHLYEKDRPNQIRGVSELAVSIMRLRDVADYEDALRVKKKIEACFVAFVSGSSVTQSLGDLKSGQTNSKIKEETMRPGMIKYQGAGDTIQFGQPSSSGDSADYLRHNVHVVAAGWGMNYMMLTGDYGDANYSSAKMAVNEFRQGVEQSQWLTLVPMLLKPIRAWWRQTAPVAGLIFEGKSLDKITMPRRYYVDPGKDVKAAKDEIRGALRSTSDLIREQGEDPDDVFEEIAAERKKMKSLGIVTDTDPGVAAEAKEKALAAKEKAGAAEPDKSKAKK